MTPGIKLGPYDIVAPIGAGVTRASRMTIHRSCWKKPQVKSFSDYGRDHLSGNPDNRRMESLFIRPDKTDKIFLLEETINSIESAGTRNRESSALVKPDSVHRDQDARETNSDPHGPEATKVQCSVLGSQVVEVSPSPDPSCSGG